MEKVQDPASRVWTVPDEISEWIDDGQTAVCPKCPVHSVIGSASGFPISPEFLHRMHERWF